MKKLLLQILMTCISPFLLFSQSFIIPQEKMDWSIAIEGEQLTVIWDETFLDTTSNYSISGHLAGDETSEVHLSKVSDSYFVSINGESTTISQISYSPSLGVSFEREVQYPEIAHWDDFHVEEKEKTSEPKTTVRKRVDENGVPIVDLLVVYTKESKDLQGGKNAIEALINSMVNSCNATFKRSNASVIINLIETREVNYAASNNIPKDFNRLKNKTDGFLDDVHAIRQEVYADLVLLIVDKDGTSQYGIADIPGGQKGNVNSAFSVCYYKTVGGVYPHEIGHNFGCNHNHGYPGATTFPYSYGHTWDENGTGRGSIMSYIGKRSAYFSNPDVKFNGNATGKKDYSDNARTIDNIAPFVANYFEKTIVEVDPVGPKGFEYVVDEQETVVVLGTFDIAYGANNSFVYLYNQTNNVACSNAKFGSDPSPGVKKSCFIRESKKPYSGIPILIPGTIEAEDYDKGGEEISYFDTTPDNTGNEYRSDAVDIGVGNGSYNIGWTAAGEWLEYTVNVAKATNYDLSFVTSSLNGGGKLRISLDGILMLDNISVPKTNDWGSYTSFKKSLDLPKGKHVLRFTIEVAGFNIDKMEVQEATVTSGSETLLIDDLMIYPNPSANGLFKLNKETEWEVLTALGNLINRGNGLLIDLADQPTGFYFIKAGNSVKKVIKD